MSGSIGAELSAAQAANSAASSVLQVRQKFTQDILGAGQKRASEIDRAMLASLTAELDKAISDAKILGDSISLGVAGLGMVVAAAGYLDSNDVDKAKAGVRDGMKAKLSADPGDPATIKMGVTQALQDTTEGGLKDQLEDQKKLMTAQGSTLTGDALNEAAFKALARNPDPMAGQTAIALAAKLEPGGALGGKPAVPAQPAVEAQPGPPPVAAKPAVPAVPAVPPEPRPISSDRMTALTRQTGQELVSSGASPQKPFAERVLASAESTPSGTSSPLREKLNQDTEERVQRVKDSGHAKRFGSVDQAMIQALGAMAQITGQMMTHIAERQKAERLMYANAATAASLQ